MPDAHRRRVVGVRVERAAERQRPTARPPRPSSGTRSGTGRSFASTFSSVSIRVWSVATTLATSRCGRPGTVTKMSVGLLAKLNELVMMYPSGGDDRPVVGPTPLRMPGAGSARLLRVFRRR